MKRSFFVPFLLLLAAAGLIGWFLPVLAAERQDRALEGRAESVEIRQIDLSYQSELSAADKLLMIRFHFPAAETVPFDRGLFLTDSEVRSVLERFLRELSGKELSLNGQNCSAVSELLVFGETGSILVWKLTARLDGAWRCEALVDDQTGLLLRCCLTGNPAGWDRLFPHREETEGVESYACAALSAAMDAHVRRQLPAGHSVALRTEQGAYGDLLLLEDGRECMRMPYQCVPAQGYLGFNR